MACSPSCGFMTSAGGRDAADAHMPSTKYTPRCHKISSGIALMSSHVVATSGFGHFVSDVGDCRCLALVVQCFLFIIYCKLEDNCIRL